MRKAGLIVVSLLLLAMVFDAGGVAQTAQAGWQARLRQELPLLGHRNWILIVDSAYPLQTAAGIETLETDASQLAVTQAVLAELGRTTHVRPVVFLDKELQYVPAQDYAEVNAYREGLKKALKPYPVQSLLHEEILRRLSEEAKTYKVLVLKTTMTVPYTSVFLQLDCRYLSAEGEQRIRAAMQAAGAR
ncbi:MAG: hypothetical protein PW792_17770 [Acidobacteriaceae bacterium]|nr:hypothetical protein [Acidobacteriaceae bacterium]